MNTHRKKAKEFFILSTRTEWDDFIHEAFLSKRQEQVALIKKKDINIPTWEIANLLSVSPETITRELAKIYDKIIKIKML